MSDRFPAFPLGDSITGSPHSVCVSLPKFDDIIGYGKKSPRVMDALTSGYPRFFVNPLIQQLKDHYAQRGILSHPNDPLMAQEWIASDLIDFLNDNSLKPQPAGPFFTVHLKGDSTLLKLTKEFLQHSGTAISSRQAETELINLGLSAISIEARSELSSAENQDAICQELHRINHTAYADDNLLCQGGMNAFYATFRAIQSIQLDRDRDVWIQLGWLYVDTIRVLQKWALAEDGWIQIINVTNLHDLKLAVTKYKRRLAGIVTEVPTNPLVQCPDIEQLYQLAKKNKAALILDPTLVSTQNIQVLEFCDAQISSLTKYYALEADVMMGAISLNHQSPFYEAIRERIEAFICPPPKEDLARFAVQFKESKKLLTIVNESVPKVVAFLESHPSVDKVYWALQEDSLYNFNWIKANLSGPGSIITFTLKIPLQQFYDKTNIVKSPSFGARFTMLCPFLYLAHYEEIIDPDKRKAMIDYGLNPELIRLSIGSEPVEDIIEELNRSLS